jgi:chromosome transmission fidelity protein 4
MPREPAPPTSIAFSPIHNMVAWSDKDGVLTRWTSPIPSNLPSPITMEKIKDKPKTTAANDAITANKAKFAALFGEDVNGADGGDEDDEDMYDDDWIIDDIGVGVKDKDEKQRKSGGLREMGKLFSPSHFNSMLST